MSIAVLIAAAAATDTGTATVMATMVAAVIVRSVTDLAETVPAASVRAHRPSTSGRAATIATSPKATVPRERAPTALARMPSVPTRRVRKVTGRLAAHRAAMAAVASAAVAAVAGARPNCLLAGG